MSGVSDINVDFGDGPINMTVTFSSAYLGGTIIVKKANLGVQDFRLFFKDRLRVTVYHQPYVHLPFSLPVIPVPLTVSLSTHFEKPFCFLSFPFNTGSTWNLSATNFTINGNLQSIWFKILDVVNKLANRFGYELLPPEIAALLPIVYINETLHALGIGNRFSIPEIPYAFSCFSTENVTVPAGTYTCYNVSILGGLAHYYYAPAAGTIIKLSGNFQEVFPSLKNINIELLQTNFH
ncbi:MAG: hypothetical protein QXL17_02355 [Candidatus Thermoplasmatota archaeon]